MTSYDHDIIESIADDYNNSLLNTNNEMIYSLLNIDGILHNPTMNVEELLDIIHHFKTKDGDTFVTTYVKAGTTWTQQIIHLLLRKGEAGGVYGHSVPWLEAVSSNILSQREAPGWNLEKINNDYNNDYNSNDSIDSIDSIDGNNMIRSPRYFKTHAVLKQFPGNIITDNMRIIYIARNPKDTVVSLYHHTKSKPEFNFKNCNFHQFCKLFLLGQVENSSWFDHVITWHQQCMEHPSTHLFLKYEDMCIDPIKSIQQIASFLNLKDIDHKVIEKVLLHSSFDEMKNNSCIGLNHIRKGGYGGWRSSFTVEDNELFDEVYRIKMSGSKLKFNFGPNIHGVDIIA